MNLTLLAPSGFCGGADEVDSLASGSFLMSGLTSGVSVLTVASAGVDVSIISFLMPETSGLTSSGSVLISFLMPSAPNIPPSLVAPPSDVPGLLAKVFFKASLGVC